MNNPYSPKRTLPVGRLDYKTKQLRNLKAVEAALEYGEEDLIYDVPVLVGPGKYANLGDDFGGSAILLALGLKDRGLPGQIWTIDTYDNRSYAKKKIPQQEHALNRYKMFGVSDRIKQFKGTTAEYGQAWLDEGEMFKFAFVDASHRYKNVVEDIEYFMEMILKGGQIAVHDTNQDGPLQAVKETLVASPEWEITHWVNRIKMFKKL